MIINRNTYGSNFNVIELYDNIIIKKNKNNYGFLKILNEINFYNFIKMTDLSIYFPEIIEISINDKDHIGCIKMKYLLDYKELYTVFNDYDNNTKLLIIDKILNILTKIHKMHEYNISKDYYYNNLLCETINKINNRISEIQHIIDKYNYIEYVNGIKIKSYEDIINKIKFNINEYFETKSDYKYSIIHGDCQFSNILINSNFDIKFIDPRGYFGDTKIFGMPQYDIAKIYFALSGYDHFDNNLYDTLNIYNNNIIINITDCKIDNFITEDYFIKTLVTSIWLGNSHMYKDNINKCITSYFISLYYGTLNLQF